ncbi:hypothetical protein D3C72_2399650 [compost metagenome]
MCTDEPTPAEPKWIVSGLARASAVSSASVLAGRPGVATTTWGISATMVISFRSWAGR